MKILAAADLHGYQHRLNLILRQITQHHPDLVVICGDLTQYGPKETATAFLNQIPVRTLAIPGNIDTPDVSQGIDASSAENIDHRKIIINGIPFIGLGDLLPSTLSIMTIQDGEQRRPLEECIDKTTVLVTHVPPHHTQDKMALGPRGGSKGLRRLVEEREPRLVICGHIHEDPGTTTVGPTTIVNCSIARRGEGALIDLDASIRVTFLD